MRPHEDGNYSEAEMYNHTKTKSLQDCREWLEDGLGYQDNQSRMSVILLVHINAMEQTLRFYADKDNWIDKDNSCANGDCCTPFPLIPAIEDDGENARACLQGLEGRDHGK